jgi:type VI secretion system secreted protein Hcp
MAAVDYFLKLDGIDGESQDFKHKGEIQLESFSWGVHQVVSVGAGGGQRAGRSSFEDFHFTKPVDKASPKLMFACASGQHIKTGILSCRKAGNVERGNQDFMMIKMENLLVSSYNDAGNLQTMDGVPQDAVALNFTKITFTFIPQNADGSPGTPVTESWDLKTGSKV